MLADLLSVKASPSTMKAGSNVSVVSVLLECPKGRRPDTRVTAGCLVHVPKGRGEHNTFKVDATFDCNRSGRLSSMYVGCGAAARV